MKICFIRSDRGYPDSRVEKAMYALSGEHEVFLLGWDRNASGDETVLIKHRIRDREFDYYLIPEPAVYGGGMKKMLAPMLRFWKKAYRFLSENQSMYDAIHVVNFDTARPAFRAAHKFGKKIVYDIFDYYADSYIAPGVVKKIIRKMENGYINRADMTIICSEERREQISGASPRDLIVVLNSPENESVSDSFEIDSRSVPGRPRIVYAGMLVYDRFLREICEVVMSRDDIEWHVAGYGAKLSYIEECAASHDNIFFYGTLANEDILALEKKCDIMTALQDPSVPNNSYPAPNKFYEALMLGKPLIMVRNASLYKELLEHDIGDVIDASGDVKAEISAAFDRIISRRDEWARMGDTARKLFAGKYTWRESERALLEGYRRLV